jgi:hypothetical protein
MRGSLKTFLRLLSPLLLSLSLSLYARRNSSSAAFDCDCTFLAGETHSPLSRMRLVMPFRGRAARRRDGRLARPLVGFVHKTNGDRSAKGIYKYRALHPVRRRTFAFRRRKAGRRGGEVDDGRRVDAPPCGTATMGTTTRRASAPSLFQAHSRPLGICKVIPRRSSRASPSFLLFLAPRAFLLSPPPSRVIYAFAQT